MDTYRFSVLAHLFFSILLIGLALFWFIMRIALNRRFAAGDATRLLAVAQASRWPHVAVPYKWRLPLPWLTWAVIAGTWISGILIMNATGRSTSSEWWPKWALVIVVTVIQALMTFRTRPGLFNIQLVALLATIAVSAWLARIG